MAKKERAPMNKILAYKNAVIELSKKEKVGQCFMPAAFINDKEEEIRALEQLIVDNNIGGLCFFHSRASAATNYEGEKEVILNEQSFQTLQKLIERYQQKSKHRLLIAIDAEWGLAMRIENTPQYPYAVTLGAIQGNLNLIFEVGRNIAWDCKQAGIHYNLSPVADINNNPNNPVIGYRSFGEDKKDVALKSSAYIKGMKSEGTLSSAKHFPGHGDTEVDSHLGLPVITKSKEDLLNNELYPFRKLVDEGIDSIMVGHLSVPALSNGNSISSSISKDIIKGLLREEFGFEGVVISDALNMHAVSKNYPTKGELEWLAFDAGNDILCFAERTKEGIETILKNASEKQIDEVFERVWRLKEKAIRAEQNSKKELRNPDALNYKLAEQSITLATGSVMDIATFKAKGYACVSVSKEHNTIFGSLLQRNGMSAYSVADTPFEKIKDQLKEEVNIVLALYPPQVTPMDNFGFTKEEVHFINELLGTKNVVLYLFGNPYSLKVFDYADAKSVVVAYQDFKVFQKVAAKHFFGKIEAVGKLPVNI